MKITAADVDRAIDHTFWHKLMKLRAFGYDVQGRFGLKVDPLDGVPVEALAEFPPHWIESVRVGAYVLPESILHIRTLLALGNSRAVTGARLARSKGTMR